MPLRSKAKLVRERLAEARRVLVVTGAGISAESGIPTFRGDDGYWKQHRAEDLASPEGFARNPQLVWEWYNHRRRVIAECQPNSGHRAVAELERRAADFMLITQNVDGLHQQAGSRQVVEIHGSIWRVRRADDRGASYEDRTVFADADMPLRNSAGHLLRPAVVWFGEMLPQGELERIDNFLDDDPIDLCLVIGTSAIFSYIVNFAYVVKRQGGMVVEVNPEPSLPPGCAELVIREKAGDFLPLLIAEE